MQTFSPCWSDSSRAVPHESRISKYQSPEGRNFEIVCLSARDPYRLIELYCNRGADRQTTFQQTCGTALQHSWLASQARLWCGPCGVILRNLHGQWQHASHPILAVDDKGAESASHHPVVDHPHVQSCRALAPSASLGEPSLNVAIAPSTAFAVRLHVGATLARRASETPS